MPKRYLAFAYDTYYPAGGMGDSVGDFDTLPEAWAAIVDRFKMEPDHHEVIDLTTLQEVPEAEYKPKR